MAPLPERVRALIETGPLAHLVTMNADGSPQVTVVWIVVEGDEIVSGHLYRHRKVRNVERNPTVALSLESPGANELGMRNYVVLYGRALITEGGAPELLQRLAHVYVGPDVLFPPMPDPPPGFVTRITVDRVAGLGPWSDDA